MYLYVLFCAFLYAPTLTHVHTHLSFHQDRIETHLTSEIAAKYSSFFEASIYIQELRNDVERLVDEVRSKRAVMGGLGEDTRQGSQTNEVLRNRKENLLHTLELVTVCCVSCCSCRFVSKTMLTVMAFPFSLPVLSTDAATDSACQIGHAK